MVDGYNSGRASARRWSLWPIVFGVACATTPDEEGDGNNTEGSGGVGATGGMAATGGVSATGGTVGDGGTTGTGGGTAGTGGVAATGGLSSSGGGTGTGGGAVDENACGNGVANEAHVPEMVSAVCETSNIPNCNITDFSALQFDAASGEWGDEMSLTGGSFDYSDEESTLSWEVAGDQLSLTGAVVAGGYIGFGLWFGPCTDATDFEGLEITVGGDLGGGTLEVQLNTDENYPVGERDNFGSCAHAEGEEWSDCTNNSFTLPAVAATESTFQIPWSDFTGGTPVATLSPNQLGGVQLQASCGEEVGPCDVSLDVYDVRFYRAGTSTD